MGSILNIKWEKKPVCGWCKYYKKGLNSFTSRGICKMKNSGRSITGQKASACKKFVGNTRGVKKLLINNYGKRNSKVLKKQEVKFPRNRK